MNQVRDKMRMTGIFAIPVALMITMLVLAKPMDAFDVRMVLVWAFLLGGIQGALMVWTIIGRRTKKPENPGSLME